MIDKSIRKFLVLIFSLILFLCASKVQADDKCSFTVSTVDFSSYNVFQYTANDFGVGSVDINCYGKEIKKYTVSLSTGQSNTFTNRVMNSGTNMLQYNLFTSAARDVVWGDGSGGSSTISGDKKSPTQMNIFGSMNPLQDVSIGYYSDFITVSIEF